jgi:hypothetical protein
VSAKATTDQEQYVQELRPLNVREWMLPGWANQDGPIPIVQDPLTFFEKTEFVGLIAKVIDRAFTNGMNLTAIAGSLNIDPETVTGLRAGSFSVADLPAAEEIVRVFVKLFSEAPELLEDLYMIALSFPPSLRGTHERPGRARVAIRGMDDEMGFGVMETFVEQNASALAAFTMRWWEQIQRHMARIRPGETTETTETTEPADGSESWSD